MNTEDPETHFRMGLAALKLHRPAEALEHFRTAITVERDKGVVRPQMRYISYYGLSMALANRNSREVLRLCQRAAASDPFDPVLQLNLGKVYLRTGRRARAIEAFNRGLAIEPSNPALSQALAGAERRRKPPLGWLDRDHPLNRTLGRLRASITKKAS